MAYHSFKTPEGDAYGSFETFRVYRADVVEDRRNNGPDAIYRGAGWYWWACFPGCMPDGDPSGPFPSESAARRDALASCE